VLLPHRFTASTTLPYKHVAAIDCCNDQAAGAGTYHGNGTSQTGTSGLPFTQVVFCRLDTPETFVVPFGTVGYFDSTIEKCVVGLATRACFVSCYVASSGLVVRLL